MINMASLKEIQNQISQKYPRGKKIIGVLLIILGLLALITPLTPGSWLAILGLELIGVRLAAWEKVKAWFVK